MRKNLHYYVKSIYIKITTRNIFYYKFLKSIVILKNILKIFLNLVFPPRCISCESPVAFYDSFCEICFNEYHNITTKSCIKCAFPLNDYSSCPECARSEFLFDECYSVCIYNKVTAGVLSNLKYRDYTHLSKFIAKQMFLFIAKKKDFYFDIITCCPMTKKDIKKRKYHQVTLIVNRFNKKNRFGLFNPFLIQKVKNTRKQNYLKRTERQKNLKDAFCVNEKYVESVKKAKKILIVDDVITTGSTVNELTKEIKKINKDVKVVAFSFARAVI